MTDDNELPSVEDTREAAANWAIWAKHDMEHFLEPIMEATGLTKQEALLYLINERLAQVIETGIDVRISAKIEHKDTDTDEPDEPWKKGKGN